MTIQESFPISLQEYLELDQKFGKLAKKAAWVLVKNNSRTSHTDDVEDVIQELAIALMKAGSYYKRQTYIEKSLAAVQIYLEDDFLKLILQELVK